MRQRSSERALTMAAARVVLPVPADPRITMATRSERSVMNELNAPMARSWSAEGLKPRWRIMMVLSASVNMAYMDW